MVDPKTAEELVRQYRWPVSGELPFLGGMTNYPPGGHTLAIAIGSTLGGLILVTGSAFVVSYLALAGGGGAHRVRFNCRSHQQVSGLFGNEVISHFFFAQSVGTAAMLVAVLGTAKGIETRFVF